jgi:3-methyladenine DNA glycosylase AlkD
MKPAEQEIQRQLFLLQDEKYRAFQCRLMPTVPPETVIGVRTPALRACAKKLRGGAEAAEFLRCLPHRYYEENNLHAFLIAEMRSAEETFAAVETFLPYVNNWATCDQMNPKAFRKHPPELPERISAWLASGRVYTVRFGIGVLMNHYLEPEFFRKEYPALAAQVRSGEYYVRMMQAWYFATALAKQWEAVLPFLEERRLEPWTHNRTIQKARESARISEERKAYLQTLKLQNTEG